MRTGDVWYAAFVAVGSMGMLCGPTLGEEEWTKHVIHSGFHTATVVAADFTGDGKIDVISNSGGKTRLFVAPKWKEVVLDENANRNCIHSEVMDVDGDGDPDWIGARYEPGLIFWLERPASPLTRPWPMHLVDDQVIGIHGLLVGDVDRKKIRAWQEWIGGRQPNVIRVDMPRFGPPQFLDGQGGRIVHTLWMGTDERVFSV